MNWVGYMTPPINMAIIKFSSLPHGNSNLIQYLAISQFRSKFTCVDLSRGKGHYIRVIRKIDEHPLSRVLDDDEEFSEIPYVHKLEYRKRIKLLSLKEKAANLRPEGDTRYDNYVYERKFSELFAERVKAKGWIGGVQNSETCPLTAKSPGEFLFEAPSKALKFDPDRYFSWLAGFFDASGHIYFGEEIYRGPIKENSNELKEKIAKKITVDVSKKKKIEQPTLIPEYFYKRYEVSFTARYLEFCKNYTSELDELSNVPWPKRVAEILFPNNELNTAYSFKNAIRFSYVTKTKDGFWAWRCGDSNGLIRLARMLKGRLKTQHAIQCMERLCYELNLPKLIDKSQGPDPSLNQWLTGFLNITLRVQYDFVNQKPYASIVWRDKGLLYFLRNNLKTGRVKEYVNVTSKELTNLDNNVSIFTDYSNEIFLKELPADTKEPPFKKSIETTFWKKEFISSREHLCQDAENESCLVNNLSSTNNLDYCDPLEPSSFNKLYELRIDSIDGLSRIVNQLIFFPTHSLLNSYVMDWKKIFIAQFSNFFNGNILTNIIPLNISYMYRSTCHWPDLDTNSILLKRSLPKYSLYDCQPQTHDAWIRQFDDTIISKILDVPLNRMFLSDTWQENENPIIRYEFLEYQQKFSKKLLHKVDDFACNNMGKILVDKKPLGMDGASYIASRGFVPTHRAGKLKRQTIKNIFANEIE